MTLARLGPAALLLSAALLLGGCGGSDGSSGAAGTTTAGSPTSTAAAATTATGGAGVVYSADGTTVTLPGVGGTVLAAMDSAGVPYEAKGEDANAYVTSINGVAADDSKKQFWSLYVNDQQSQTGAGSATASASDTITWKLETY